MDKFDIKILDKKQVGNKKKTKLRIFLKNRKDNETMTRDDAEFIYEQFIKKYGDVSQMMGRNPYHISSMVQNGQWIDYDDEYSRAKVDDGYDEDKLNKYYYFDLSFLQ